MNPAAIEAMRQAVAGAVDREKDPKKKKRKGKSKPPPRKGKGRAVSKESKDFYAGYQGKK